MDREKIFPFFPPPFMAGMHFVFKPWSFFLRNQGGFQISNLVPGIKIWKINQREKHSTLVVF
ncbi:hypothetical protein EBI_27071 [Enterocytozoon bieneusi H348]|nr:hypothetical protein EBI_27071 [Enterocytozoon bieneusi H348]|eukprot:XP_002651879.1 hypothetical protein EBI_27071 [Enterocytozoon bieneusi H348]